MHFYAKLQSLTSSNTEAETGANNNNNNNQNQQVHIIVKNIYLPKVAFTHQLCGA